MTLTREQLLDDLHVAYLDARRHKRNKDYQLRFEAQLEENLEELCDALYTRSYRPLPSSCFIITEPKKCQLHCRHYGRYVDDCYVVSADRQWLLSLVPHVRTFLAGELGLSFHDGKLRVTSIWHGTEFLGTWVKPRRIYASRATVSRMKSKLHVLAHSSDRTSWYASLNSYCGVLSHWNNYRLRRCLLTSQHSFAHYGLFNMAYTKYENFESGLCLTM